MMRTKLGLTDKELMNRTWISLQLEMADFPSYNYEKDGKDVKITDKKQGAMFLNKLKDRRKQ